MGNVRRGKIVIQGHYEDYGQPELGPYTIVVWKYRRDARAWFVLSVPDKVQNVGKLRPDSRTVGLVLTAKGRTL